MSIQSEIAKIGESPAFITAMAHAWFAYAVLATCAHFGLSFWIAVPACVIIAAWKEFYADVRFEKNPPQTLLDGLGDFSEYMGGIVLAMVVFRL